MLLIVRWPTHSADFDGSIYGISAYRASVAKSGNRTLMELGDIENDVSGENDLDGTLNGKPVVYPYKDKASVLGRLRALGYMK